MRYECKCVHDSYMSRANTVSCRGGTAGHGSRAAPRLINFLLIKLEDDHLAAPGRHIGVAKLLGLYHPVVDVMQ